MVKMIPIKIKAKLLFYRVTIANNLFPSDFGPIAGLISNDRSNDKENIIKQKGSFLLSVLYLFDQLAKMANA